MASKAAGSGGRAERLFSRRNTGLERRLVTPEGVALDIRLAGAGARFGALLLDMFFLTLIAVAYILLLWALYELVQGSTLVSLYDRMGTLAIVVSIIFLFLLRNGYFLLFELGPRGATWGKRIMGIRVASRDGGRLQPEAIIARNLLREIEIFLPMQFLTVLIADDNSSSFTLIAGTLWILLFSLFLLFNRDRLRCGDLLAGTWVVMAPRQALTEVVAPQDSMARQGTRDDAHVFTDEELSIYGEYELQTLEQVLRDGSEESLRTVYIAICTKLGWEAGAGDERPFLENYYTQLRQKLETGMRFGKRRADKFEQEG